MALVSEQEGAGFSATEQQIRTKPAMLRQQRESVPKQIGVVQTPMKQNPLICFLRKFYRLFQECGNFLRKFVSDELELTQGARSQRLDLTVDILPMFRREISRKAEEQMRLGRLGLIGNETVSDDLTDL